MRFGTAAILGRSNVGKSTFLNTALGEPLAIVSPLPQTTRDALLGIARYGDAQIAFFDTPGLHQPRSELGRRMNVAALEAARAADVIVLMTDVSTLLGPRRPRPDRPELDPLDRKLIESLPPAATTPSLLVINKVDLLRDKSRLLPLIEAFAKLHEFYASIPTSVTQRDGVDIVLDEIAARLPEGPPGYDADTLTDRPVTFFIREYVREQVLLAARREVPHAVAVSIENVDESPKSLSVQATLHVEKPGQRKIVVGKGGSQIKEIGTAARRRIQTLVGKKVHLELFVRVTPRWRNAARLLAELGYDAHTGRT
jgi:GTP-binding protein Era